MENQIDLSLYWGMFKRRFPVFAVVSAVLLAIVVFVTFSLPAVYRSEARIIVESQRLPNELVQTTVNVAADEQIQLIQQRLMTRDNLLSIAREFNLYDIPGRSLSPTVIVDEMREATEITAIQRSGGRRGSTQAIAFTVAFEYQNAGLAAKVANRFVEIILEQNIRSRQTRAQQTRAFLEKELAARNQELVQLEAEVVTFKNENVDALPESLSFRRQQLGTVLAEINAIEEKMITLREESRLIREQAEATGNVSLTAQGNVVSPEVQEMQKLEIQLTRMRGLYSDNHPVVRQVKGQLAALKDRIGPNPGAPDTGEAAGGGEEESQISPAGNYQLSLVDRQMQLLEKRLATLQDRAGSIETTISRTPEVEIALEALRTRREGLKQTQAQLIAKMNVAEIGERIEQDRQGERFEVIEQATVSPDPVSPQRPLILAGGSVVSLGAGIALIILLELLDGRIRSVNTVRNRFQIEPIVTIPYVETVVEKRFRRVKIVGVIAAVAVAIFVGLAAIHFLHLPLGILWELMIRKIEVLMVTL